MATSSNEFAALVNQLHKSPNDPALKQAVVQHLPQMMALAKDNNPMALYHLAHIYPPTSSQYKQTMRQAANLGCTNAMLVMCQLLVKSGDVSDFNKAAHYLRMIKKSNDTFINEQVDLLLAEHPELALTTEKQAKPKLCYNNAHRFFQTAPREVEETAELTSVIACGA
ncbi:MAG: hypothetical protein ACRCXC_01695 [Legionella sp.]